MSGVGEAAAIIGITDFALQNIKGVYNPFHGLSDVPEDLARIRVEISGIQTELSNLECLSQAEEKTVSEVQVTGITKAVNDCGEHCDKLEKLVAKWVKHSEKSSRDRLRVVLNKAKIQKYRTVLGSTARTLESAIGILILTINVSNRSPEHQAAEMERIREAVASWKIEADEERSSLSTLLAELDKSYEDEAEYLVEELNGKGTFLDHFVRRCDATVAQLQAMKLEQEIKDIHTAEEAEVQVGMPKEAVEKVSRQFISNVRTERKGKAQVGIW